MINLQLSQLKALCAHRNNNFLKKNYYVDIVMKNRNREIIQFKTIDDQLAFKTWYESNQMVVVDSCFTLDGLSFSKNKTLILAVENIEMITFFETYWLVDVFSNLIVWFKQPAIKMPGVFANFMIFIMLFLLSFGCVFFQSLMNPFTNSTSGTFLQSIISQWYGLMFLYTVVYIFLLIIGGLFTYSSSLRLHQLDRLLNGVPVGVLILQVILLLYAISLFATVIGFSSLPNLMVA